MTTVAQGARIRPALGWLVLLVAVTLGLCWQGLDKTLPADRWLQALFHPNESDPAELLFRQSALPRLVMSLLAGGAFGVAGSVFQHLFRNPLADPSLLGVASGAQLALTLALLHAPGAFAFGPEPVAWAGAAAALGLVFLSASRQGFSPSGLVLSGLLVNLYLGAVAGLLVLFNHDFLTDLLLWQAGSLTQSGWSGPLTVATRLTLFAAFLTALHRPMHLLELGDASSRALGLGVSGLRGFLLVAASLLVASVIGSTGLIGFVGLAAPHVGRALGVGRRAYDPKGAALIGALLLALVDQVARELSALVGEIPTGSVVAVLAGPLLLVLLSRLPRERTPPASAATARINGSPACSLGALVAIFLAVLAVALCAARMRSGWSIDLTTQWPLIRDWRLPRVFAAAGAGASLGLAGLLLQRITRNPLASPELLGVSQGAGLGLILAMLLVPSPGTATVLAFTSAGGLAALLFVLRLGWRRDRDPSLALLAGVAVGGIASGVTTFFLASGDPRVAILLSWFSGSIGRVEGAGAMALVLCTAVGLGLMLTQHRNIDALAIGKTVSASIAFPHTSVTIAGLVLSAVLTAAATITVGPLSFVGLMAPHIVRLMGFRVAFAASLAVALVGASLLVVADWVGRNASYPWPISAGLLTTFLGGPLMLAMMLKRAR